jgi:myo-inositol-1(or 4)-monophosphatase
MQYWGADVRSRYKDDGSVVTDADARADEYFRQAISAEYPDHGILSEEGADDPSRLAKPKIFILDPLDGSGDFKRKEADFCVSIALAENGKLLLGAIYEPLKNRLLFADGKAYMTVGNETSALPPLRHVDWTTSRVGHPKNYKGDKYTTLYKMLGIDNANLVSSGSMGTRMVQVALQETHMILGYTRSLGEWDVAAGHAILAPCGIRVTNIEGKPLNYNQQIPRTHNGILAVHPDIQEEALNRLRTCFDRLPM